MNAPLQVVYRPLGDLLPYARNSRTHDERQIAEIAASIREFGFTNPVLVDEDGTIIAGHGRLAAARKLGMAEIPTIALMGLSPAQKRALVIADNRIALNAGWDDDMLKVELGDLVGENFDITLLGFNDKELATLLAPPPIEGETDPDETPEPPQEPASEPGDVWILGRHRLVCGDSTDPEAVAKALNGVTPMLMVTDPPYGVEYDAGWRADAGAKSPGMKTKASHKHAGGKVENDDRADWTAAWTLFPGDVAYVWHGEKQLVGVAQQLQTAGFELRNLIVWGKSQQVIGRGNYHSQHETAWYVVRRGGTGHWAGDRKQTTLWQIDKPMKSETGHSTQKPVECMARPIRNNSSPGQAVYEPFSGSGTTIIACEQEGRSCHAIEISPAYVDVAVTRWEKFTGQLARLEETGETFVQVLARRRPGGHVDAAPAAPKKGTKK